MSHSRHWEVARAASLATVLLLSIGGCRGSSEDEDESGPPKPKSVAFTGKTDPRLTGDWKASDGSSELALVKDGGLVLSASNPGRPGPPNKMQGEWRVDGDRLLLKYANSDGSEQTIGYAMKIAGDTMTLSTKVPKRDTVYKRQPR
ncbi:hypothetical protein EON77_01375 [bacterium]|nr:MAG: hypothetical protein EON77_01375 [bacterium]